MAESDVNVLIEHSPQSSDVDEVTELPMTSKILGKNNGISTLKFSSIEEVDE